MNITIRTATSADVETIADFNVRIALETESKRLDVRVLREGAKVMLRDPSHGVYYIAEVDGTIVGQAMITYEWSDWRNGQFWWIQSVYVPPEWRRKKVFTALYDHILKLAKEMPGVCGIRLYTDVMNDGAQETYRKLGMKKTAYEMYEVDLTEGTAE